MNFSSLRRRVFTYVDFHSVDGCYRYYYLFGWEACRFKAMCPHDIVQGFNRDGKYTVLKMP